MSALAYVIVRPEGPKDPVSAATGQSKTMDGILLTAFAGSGPQEHLAA